ncbi:hypothetical protein B5X24_HaOG206244 [Helicoverpa armigera]|nr:hypothetical protein B5X24_HaOG206244 [Helicoverpa armigera]
MRFVFHSKTVCSSQDILKKMRVMDDKILYALNTSIPTESFASKVDAHSACEDLYSQIQKGHSDRENVIKNCILATAETVKHLKTAKDKKPDDYEVLKNLKAEQKKVCQQSLLNNPIILLK